MPIEEENTNIAVVVPVYKGVALTIKCLKAALESVRNYPNTKLVIINDCSPDKNMANELKRFASENDTCVDLISNTENLGFTKTVNIALKKYLNYDIILLNSDTISFNKNMVTQLKCDAYSKDDIATVTPLSNSTEICSFPVFMSENDFFTKIFAKEINNHFMSPLLPLIEAPTGIGFCMYIKRSAINEVGIFDEEKFPRGYGEENDFCQRAIKNGWKNIISPNLYVFHEGSVSFGKTKNELVASGLQKINTDYPNYSVDLMNFIQSDPLKEVRIFRFLRFISDKKLKKVLHISHDLGGGVLTHVQELCEHLECNGVISLVLTPKKNGDMLLQIGGTNKNDGILFAKDSVDRKFFNFLKSIGIGMVHFHHVINLPENMLEISRVLNCKHIFTFHDFFTISGNPKLTNRDGQFVTDPSEWNDNPLYKVLELEVIESYRKMMKKNSLSIFPSEYALNLVSDHLEVRNPIVARHLEKNRIPQKVSLVSDNNFGNVGIIGAIGIEKGANVIEQLSQINLSHNQFNIILIGYACKPLKLVNILGEYKEQDVIDLLEKNSVGIILFPARWPETYSYTLSLALQTDLPIVAPDIGAFPERLSGRKNTILFPFDINSHELFLLLTEFKEKLSSGAAVYAPVFNGEANIHIDFYETKYINMISSILGNGGIKFLDVAELNINTHKIKNNLPKRIIKRLLWRLYLNPYFRFLNSPRLMPLRSLVLKFLN